MTRRNRGSVVIFAFVGGPIDECGLVGFVSDGFDDWLDVSRLLGLVAVVCGSKVWVFVFCS